MIDKIRGIAADIDMTLTSKGDPLPEVNVRALNLMHSKGVLVGVATGRSMREKLKHLGEEWGLDFELDFLVCLNGGQVYDRETDTFYTTEKMTVDELKSIITYMMPLIDKYRIAVNTEGGSTKVMNIDDSLLESAKRHGIVMEDTTGDIDAFCDTPCYKMLLRLEPKYQQEVVDTFLNRFSDDYQMVATYPGTVEIMHKGIDKGSGLERYAAMKGLSVQDFIAFGDNENDNSLLQKAGWGVCLCDGNEATKAYADDLTDYGCFDSGVGHYLLDHCMDHI